MTKYFSQIFNKNIIKKEVNTVINRARRILGSLGALGNHNFSNKAKVTLISHTAHIGNEMNMPNIGPYISVDH